MYKTLSKYVAEVNTLCCSLPACPYFMVIYSAASVVRINRTVKKVAVNLHQFNARESNPVARVPPRAFRLARSQLIRRISVCGYLDKVASRDY